MKTKLLTAAAQIFIETFFKAARNFLDASRTNSTALDREEPWSPVRRRRNDADVAVGGNGVTDAVVVRHQVSGIETRLVLLPGKGP